MLEELVVVRYNILEGYATEIRHHADKPALLVWNQPVVHDRVSLKARLLFVSEHPTRNSSYRTRVQTAAHEHGDSVAAQTILNRHPQKIPKVLDIILAFFVMEFRRLLKCPVFGDANLAFRKQQRVP